jgi:MFS family permease
MKSEKISSYQWLLFITCFISTALGGTSSTLMSVYLPVAVKDLLGDKNPSELNYLTAYINSLFVFGMTAGGFIWGYTGDRLGRKKALILSVACFGLFTLLTGYMNSWVAVVICRFMSGFGVGGVLVTTTTIMIEEWSEKTKAIFVGILSISIPVGIFSAGLINYIVTSWRQAFMVGAIPLAIAFISIWLIRESTQWINSVSQTKQKSSQAPTIFSKDQRYNLFIGSVIFGTMLIGLWAIFSWLPTWIQSVSGDADANQRRGMSMMLLGMGGITGGFFSGWLANKTGLRTLILICFAGSAILSFILFKTNSAFNPLIYAEIALLALFFGISQGALSLYIPQLFPTNIRATATGFCFNIGRIFTATAVLFVGVLVTVLGGYGNALFIFSLVFVIGFFATLILKSNAKGIVDCQDESVLNQKQPMETI